MVAKKDKKLDFEASLKTLTALVEKMEHGNLSLEDSLSHFESGVTLIRNCQSALAAAEQKVKILTKGGDTLADFDTND